MKELKLGIITNKELAEWFGLSYGTFRNNKQKKLEELKEYASFIETKNKIKILSIDIPIYVKKKEKQFDIVKSHIDETWAENGLDTKVNVSNKIYAKKDEYKITLSPNTTYAYVCVGARELYGDPRKMTTGEIGKSRYALCVLDAKTKEARWFTKEEYAKKQEIKAKYFKSKNASEIEEQKEVIMQQARKKKISDDEAKAWIYDMEKQLYYDYLDELEEALGDNILVYRTYVQRGYFWGENVDVDAEAS